MNTRLRPFLTTNIMERLESSNTLSSGADTHMLIIHGNQLTRCMPRTSSNHTIVSTQSHRIKERGYKHYNQHPPSSPHTGFTTCHPLLPKLHLIGQIYDLHT